MNNNINPFHELYFTESIDSDDFVKLFSDVLVQPALPLFKPGNVILKGLPGSGKTMMLNLLKPSIRLAYHKAEKKFPVPPRFNKFIGAGINLVRSSISDFGQRPINENKPDDLNELGLYFGDFLNYWVCRDILDSIEELAPTLAEEIGIDISSNKLDKFVRNLVKDDCWFGYLQDVNDFVSLKSRLKERTKTYRSFLNYNLDFLPVEISQSKTSIGVPIITLVQKLRENNIINRDVKVYIRIDQFEELHWLDQSISMLGSTFQSVIHKLLAMRDSTVSYRIGTRPFDWQQGTQKIFGTSAHLESLRNYTEISIEEVLRRTESQKGYIFRDFAEDIFKKRLQLVFDALIRDNKDFLKEVFGAGFTAKEKAEMIVKTSRDKIILEQKGWPKKWVTFLKNLAHENPFSAKLAEAWAQQEDKDDVMHNIPKDPPYPWESKEKKYWIKERSEQAVMQIASRSRQNLIWSGKADLLNLSGGNILAFLSLCQHIWEVWMRDENINIENKIPQISPSIQTLGILESSRRWFENLSSTAKGKEIKLFISHIGGLFYRQMTDDQTMSYPGNNGFSIVREELENAEKIFKFLQEAADQGNLVMIKHTPKNKGKMRLKWYLNPILSPYFKIPAIHTKEPLYINLETLSTWLVNSKAFESKHYSVTQKAPSKKTKEDSGQIRIFD